MEVVGTMPGDRDVLSRAKRGLLEKVVAQDPKNPELTSALAEMEADEGNSARAGPC